MNNTNVFQIEDFKKPIQKPKRRKIKTIPDIINDNNSINDQIKLRAKKISDGSYSLYLDLRQAGKKEYQFLRIYVKDVKQDRERINLAVQLRNQKQKELFQNEHDFKLKNDSLQIEFVNFFDNLTKKRQRPDKSWNHTLKHLKIYTKEKPVLFKYIDEKFCEGFKEYLLKKLNSPNTAHVYFAKLKASLNKAIKDGILVKNPAQFIHISKQETQREFLTIDELKKLKKAPCKNEQTKNAFLFACYTGLRISDLKKLNWKEIQDGYIYFRQTKTAGVERLKLHNSALTILKDQKKINGNSENIFNLISDNHTGIQIKDWAKKAKLNKKVTWHVARHTFATIALSNDVDIYTVSKLLGHKDIKVTQIYSKVIDQRKDEAIDKLPKI